MYADHRYILDSSIWYTINIMFVFYLFLSRKKGIEILKMS